MSGREEFLDDTPVTIPVRFTRPPTRFEEIRAAIQQASRMAADEGFESLEEANDFNIGDDYEPESPYEFGPEDEAYAAEYVDRISNPDRYQQEEAAPIHKEEMPPPPQSTP